MGAKQSTINVDGLVEIIHKTLDNANNKKIDNTYVTDVMRKHAENDLVPNTLSDIILLLMFLIMIVVLVTFMYLYSQVKTLNKKMLQIETRNYDTDRHIRNKFDRNNMA